MIDPVLLVLVPITCGVLAMLLDTLGVPVKWQHGAGMAGVLFPCMGLFISWGDIIHGEWFSTVGGWPVPYGQAVGADSLSVPFLVLTAIVAPLAMLYLISESESRNRFPTGHERMVALVPVLAGALMGVFLARDLFNLFVFFELCVVVTYVLIAARGDTEPLKAAFTYLVIGTVASTLSLMGIGLLYKSVGVLDMAMLADRGVGTSPEVHLAAVLVVAGALTKSAVLPFHTWLPPAHGNAPTAISTILSGVTVKVGVYILARMAYISGSPLQTTYILETVPWSAIMYLGGISAVAGGVFAFLSPRIKHMLAFHTISQVGIAVTGLAEHASAGVEGDLLHVIFHGLFKALAFMCAGAAISVSGTDRMDRMYIGMSYPVIAFGFTVSALSISGVPPFPGTWSKELIYVDAPLVVEAALWLSGALTVASFSKAMYYLFIRRPSRGRGWRSGHIPALRSWARVSGEHPGTAAIIIMALITISSGVFHRYWLMALVLDAVKLLGGTPVAPEVHLLNIASYSGAGLALCGLMLSGRLRLAHGSIARLTSPSIATGIGLILAGMLLLALLARGTLF